MAFKLVKPSGFSGSKLTVYTILDDSNNVTPFGLFMRNWSVDYEGKLLDFIRRIKAMANETGAQEDFFKLNENERAGQGDNVCALFDEPDREMRLFCIRISEKIIILGNGGPKNVATWQEDPILAASAREMIMFSEIIKAKLKNGDLQFSDDEYHFTGNLTIL